MARRQQMIAAKFREGGPWSFVRQEVGEFRSYATGLPGKRALVFSNGAGEEIKVGATTARRYLGWDGEQQAIPNDTSRVQVALGKSAYDRIDALAKRMEISQSRVCAMIIAGVLRDAETLRKVLTESTLAVIDELTKS